MDSDSLLEAAVAGARRAGVHLLRAASEVVAGLTAFAEEIGNAFDGPEDGVERIDVETDDD